MYDLDLQKWNDLPEGDLTPFYQAMPDEYKHDDPVVAYRRYYQNEKAYFAKWTSRPTPTWMESYVKKPTLNELHVHLFKRSPKGLHDALIDVRVCLRCFLKVVYNLDYGFSAAKLALEK